MLECILVHIGLVDFLCVSKTLKENLLAIRAQILDFTYRNLNTYFLRANFPKLQLYNIPLAMIANVRIRCYVSPVAQELKSILIPELVLSTYIATWGLVGWGTIVLYSFLYIWVENLGMLPWAEGSSVHQRTQHQRTSQLFISVNFGSKK